MHFTPIARELAEEMIRDLYEGIPLTKNCKLRKIGHSSFHAAIDQYPDLQASYIRARQVMADRNAEEIIDIADTDPDPQRARNRIEARKWSASKLHPAQYGERLDVNVTQIVDITSALASARSRAGLLPIRDQLNVIDAQTSRSTTLQLSSARDSKSVERPELKDVSVLKLEDLLD